MVVLSTTSSKIIHLANRGVHCAKAWIGSPNLMPSVVVQPLMSKPKFGASTETSTASLLVG